MTNETSLKLTFCAGAGTVTGANFLLEGNGKKFLIDCGLVHPCPQIADFVQALQCGLDVELGRIELRVDLVPPDRHADRRTWLWTERVNGGHGLTTAVLQRVYVDFELPRAGIAVGAGSADLVHA